MKGLKAIRTKVEDESERMMKGEEEDEPLSPWSCAFHKVESGGIYVIAILGFKNRINPTYLKDILNVLTEYPRFSSLQVFDERDGKMKWVKTSLNIEDHVVIPQLDQDIIAPSTLLENYVSNLSKTRLDNSKPLWDFHILNLKTDDAETVCLLRVHHSFGDGLSLLSVLLSSTSKASAPNTHISITKNNNNPPTNYFNFWFYWNSFVDIFIFIATLLFLKDTKTPITLSAPTKSSGKRIVYKILSLDDFKLVKNATGSTVNDVVIGVIQASLSRYLNRRYGDAHRATEKENNLPKRLNVRALVPVSFNSELHDLLERKEQKGKRVKGNNIGIVLVPLTIAMKDNPLDYVYSAKATMDRKKNSWEATASAFILKLSVYLFGTKGASIVTQRIPSQTTITLSNMPGPSHEIAWRGYPISYVVPTVYGLPNALSINVHSYFDKMIINLSVDESTIPNPNQICSDLEETLKLMKNAAIAKTKMTT